MINTVVVYSIDLRFRGGGGEGGLTLAARIAEVADSNVLPQLPITAARYITLED